MRGALVLTLVKLVVQPLAVLAFARFALGLAGMPLAIVVMMAALPVGSNALIFAQRYQTLPGRSEHRDRRLDPGIRRDRATLDRGPAGDRLIPARETLALAGSLAILGGLPFRRPGDSMSLTGLWTRLKARRPASEQGRSALAGAGSASARAGVGAGRAGASARGDGERRGGRRRHRRSATTSATFASSAGWSAFLRPPRPARRRRLPP